MIGWISLHRKIQDHWLFPTKRPFTEFEAWIDILMEVNHDEKKCNIGNQLYHIKVGESLKSLDTWSKRWNWNKSKTRRFLSLLEKDKMIELKNEIKTTRLTVCNYASYQSNGNASETQVKRKRNASETQVTPNNNINNYNNDNNENKIEFDVFWNLYDKKVDYQACKKKWEKIPLSIYDTIFEHVKRYVASTPDKQFRRNPETYLNNNGWESEILTPKTETRSIGAFSLLRLCIA